MGHLHYQVRDIEANKRFWRALGGEPGRIGNKSAPTAVSSY
jgi:hypothetical protein